MGWKRGDVLMKSEPYALVLSHKLRTARCSYCLERNEDLKRCTACSVLRYCGRQCQRKDWVIHKTECKCVQRVAPNTPTDSVLLMLRLVIKYMAGEHSKPADGDSGLKTFQTLMSHVQDVKNDPDRCDAFSKICHTLTLLAGSEMQLPTSRELLEIFGRMVVNTFTIADAELQDIGSGVYLSPAILDHRCHPNAVVTFQGRSLYVRAVEDISNGDLSNVAEHVFVSYLDQLAPSWERQRQLQQQYYFLCTCTRCSDNSLDQLMTGGDTAQDHGKRDVEEMIQHLSQLCQTLVDEVDRLKKSGEEPQKLLLQCKDCLAQVEGHLSPYNVYKLRVLDRALDAAITCGQWEAALDYGLQTVQPYRRLYPEYSPNLALQLMRVGKLQLWLGYVQDAHASLTEAEKMVKVALGRDSNLYQQLGQLLHECVTDIQLPSCSPPLIYG